MEPDILQAGRYPLWHHPSRAEFWNRWLTFALLPLAFWGIAAFYQKVSTRDLSAERSCLWFLVGYLCGALRRGALLACGGFLRSSCNLGWTE